MENSVNNNKWERYSEIKNLMFAARTREEWDSAVTEMGELVKQALDEKLTQKARNYYTQLKEKKEAYLKESEERAAKKNQRKQYAGGTRQPMLRDDVQDALKGCLEAVAEFYRYKYKTLLLRKE